MAGFGDLLKGKKDGGQLLEGLAGAAGQIFGNATKPAVDQATQAAGQAATAAGNFVRDRAIAVMISTQLPEQMDLNKSKNFTTYIENSLTALGYKGVKPDGKPDKATLDAINDLRQKGGKDPIADVSQFGKEDLKMVVDALKEKGTPHANNILNATISTLGGIKSDYPLPKAPATQNDPAMNAGG